MAQNSNIEWTNHTANLWWGCTNVHEGCDNCYAETLAKRYGVEWGNDALRREIKGVWGNLLGMQAKARAAGAIHRVFVGSMMDIFEKPMPVIRQDGSACDYKTDALRNRFFAEIIPTSPNLLFLLLTKRPSNINKMIPEAWKTNPPKNVMFGASVVNPKTAVDVHRHLSQVNGARFYSVEPQLSFINFDADGILNGIDWLIQGGESGPGRRPFNTDWARHTRDVCAQAGKAYFFKQVDKVQPVPPDLMVRQFPELQTV
jgi:protein gp37